MDKPVKKPTNKSYSSGPCPKRPGWSPEALSDAPLGRSHRAKIGKAKLAKAIEDTREFLSIPKDYRIGIMAGSDTGAFECAMWSLLGPRQVEVLVWESFSKGWAGDVTKELKLDGTVKTADYGKIPDLNSVDWSRDVIFVWNGTTSGVKVPNGDWIPANRQGLSICDATSAVFAMDIPWDKVDVCTYSWQKCLGGEAAHGMLILSPRAVERFESHTPKWPVPKIFRIGKGGKLDETIFQGSTINTPSMLCVEDYLDALTWGKQMGGLKALIAASEKNLATVTAWVKANPAFAFLAEDPAIRSNTSVCLSVVEPEFKKLSAEDQAARLKKITGLLEKEDVAYDIGSYRDAPPGFRIWCGPTVSSEDLSTMLPWLAWAFQESAKG